MSKDNFYFAFLLGFLYFRRFLLSFVPQVVLLFEREIADFNAALFADGFHISETVIELLIGFP